jgi:capsule polysaccharide export protein KpsE/RkpR
MENNTKKQRSPSEIIAETEARLAKLREREAKVQARNNPEVLALLADRERHQKDLREARKILGSGPQSAQARIEKHTAWIDKIKDEAQKAEISVDTSVFHIEQIDKKIDNLIKEQAYISAQA